ncbi:MAG: HAD-IA family hydrolase [Caldithrix sp.]|nr:HAD-IA family hydrolase [Caldithrix sp.]
MYNQGVLEVSLKGIIFDFDGVVVKSMEQHFEAWQKAFAEKNVTINPDEFFIMEGQGIHTISRKLGQKYGLTEKDVMDIMNRKVNYYNQFMHIEFYDYFDVLLERINKKGWPVGVVTGGSRSRVEKIINQYFNHTFDCLVTVDDVQRGKPYADPFLKGAELLHLEPQECVVIENAPMGIEGAKAAQMTVIAITTTLEPHHLSEADFIAHDFKEVEKILYQLFGGSDK